MLEMSDVSIRFGATQALSGVGLRARPGEIHALLGANGAGKSTLMKVLGGLYPEAEGRVVLDGQRVELRSPREALVAGVGMVYQEFDLVPQLTGSENIMLGRPSGSNGRRIVPYFSRRAVHADAAELVQRYGFDLPLDRRVEELTVGTRQLIQVMKVLALDSRVVVLDEPTARLTAAERDDLFAVMRQLADDGKMVVFISHYLEEVLQVSDRVTILRDGRVVFVGDSAAVTAEQIGRHMVGRDVDVGELDRSADLGDVVCEVRGLTLEPHFAGVDIQVRAGEVVGLTGIAGSGRHQVIRSIVGQLRAKGRVDLRGRRRRVRSPQSVIGRGIGFVPEDRRLEGIIPERSIESNVMVSALPDVSRLGFVRGREARRRAAHVVTELDVRCAGPKQPIAQLSGGNQQKVLIGRWLEGDSDLVVLESPTVGVDVVASHEIHRHVRRMANLGKAVLVSSDDLDELQNIADRILVMVRGRIVADFPHTVARERLLTTLGGAT